MEPRDLLHEEGGEGRYRIDADLHFEDHHVKQIWCCELCHGEFCGSCFPDDEPCGCMIIEKEELSSLRSRLEKAEDWNKKFLAGLGFYLGEIYFDKPSNDIQTLRRLLYDGHAALEEADESE